MANVVVERVAKSRVSNRSDSKKSDSGTQKVGYFVGYCALFPPNFMGFFIRSGTYSTWKSRVRVAHKSRVPVGYPKIWVPAPPLGQWLHLKNQGGKWELVIFYIEILKRKVKSAEVFS
jgi:hypothetical protein